MSARRGFAVRPWGDRGVALGDWGCGAASVGCAWELVGRFGVLGPVEVYGAGGGVVPVGGPREVVLFAVLLVSANRAVSADLEAEVKDPGEASSKSSSKRRSPSSAAQLYVRNVA